MTEKLSTGPKLPYNIDGGRMASSPDGNGVLLFGGRDDGRYSVTASIFELRSDGKGWVGPWKTLTAKLQYPRSFHVVIPIFTDIDAVACKSKG